MSASPYEPTIIPPPPDPLVVLAANGDENAWTMIVSTHRARLRTLIRLRLDPRLAGLLDPSDVLQETFQEAHRRLPRYAAEPKIGMYLWLRTIAGDQLARANRTHLNTQMRSVARSAGSAPFLMPDASSATIANGLLAREKSPDEAAIREERRHRLIAALDTLSGDDREVLVLRHFEQLTAEESAFVLGITEGAARKRYLRALERLTDALKDVPGGLKGFLS